MLEALTLAAALLSGCTDSEDKSKNNSATHDSDSSTTHDTAAGTTDTTDTSTIDTGDTNGIEQQPPVGPYPNYVLEASTYDEVLTDLAMVQPGDNAILDISAYWCGYCQGYKPYFDYMASFDNGQHLWIRAEDLQNMDPASEDMWSDWANNSNSPVTMASCWSGKYYYPQIHVLEAEGGGTYLTHEVHNRWDFLRLATDAEISAGAYTYTDSANQVVIFNDNRDENELSQVDDGAHKYD